MAPLARHVKAAAAQLLVPLLLLLGIAFAAPGMRISSMPRSPPVASHVSPIRLPESVGRIEASSVDQTALSDVRCLNLEQKFRLDDSLAKPDFVFIGVAKGGSTSFSQYLPAHPDVREVRLKEPNFWTYPEVMHMTAAGYQRMLATPAGGANYVGKGASQPDWATDPIRGQGSLCGEYSTSYIVHPLAPRRLFTEVPDAKIILFLRNPIDRAYSQYTMQKRAGSERELSFEEVINLEIEEYPPVREAFRNCFSASHGLCDAVTCFPRMEFRRHSKSGSTYLMRNELDLKTFLFTSYLARSVYDDMVERWLTVFPREQVKIVQSERFFDEPADVMAEISDWLGLSPFDWGQAGVLGESWGGGASNAFDPRSYDKLAEETRAALKRFFRPYNERLFSIIGEEFGWE